jgi:hypothetical protein
MSVEAPASAADFGLPEEAVAEDVTQHITRTYVPDVPWTEEELAKIAELKATVGHIFPTLADGDKAYWTSDHAMRRLLVARSMNVAAAAKMYEHMMAFRAARQCHRLLDRSWYREPETLRRYFPWGFVGKDRDGFPVLVERIGNIDLVGIHAAVGTEDFLQWVCWYHEVQESMMKGVSDALGKDRRKMTVIIDMAHLALRHLNSSTLSVLKSRTRLEEENYPEVVRRVILINTPSMFASVWGIVKRFMDEGTVDKMQILGTDYLPTLRTFIDDDNIPAFLGGKLTDESGDAEVRSMVSEGGIIPPSFVHGIAADNNGAGEEVSIAAGKCSDVLIHVPAGSKVSWNMAAVGNDVNFTVTAVPAAAPVSSSAASAAPSSPSKSSSAAAQQPISVTQSVYGVHILSPDYTGGNPSKLPNASGVADSKPIPGSATNAAEVAVVPTARVTKHKGAYTVPESAAPNGMIVRLRFDNGYSWMSGKTVLRRVDVLLKAAETTEAAEATEAAATTGSGSGSVGAVVAALRAEDPGNELALARERHRERIMNQLSTPRATA